jgi:hypothetical protein
LEPEKAAASPLGPTIPNGLEYQHADFDQEAEEALSALKLEREAVAVEPMPSPPAIPEPDPMFSRGASASPVPGRVPVPRPSSAPPRIPEPNQVLRFEKIEPEEAEADSIQEKLVGAVQQSLAESPKIVPIVRPLVRQKLDPPPAPSVDAGPSPLQPPVPETSATAQPEGNAPGIDEAIAESAEPVPDEEPVRKLRPVLAPPDSGPAAAETASPDRFASEVAPAPPDKSAPDRAEAIAESAEPVPDEEPVRKLRPVPAPPDSGPAAAETASPDRFASEVVPVPSDKSAPDRAEAIAESAEPVPDEEPVRKLRPVLAPPDSGPAAAETASPDHFASEVAPVPSDKSAPDRAAPPEESAEPVPDEEPVRKLRPVLAPSRPESPPADSSRLAASGPSAPAPRAPQPPFAVTPALLDHRVAPPSSPSARDEAAPTPVLEPAASARILGHGEPPAPVAPPSADPLPVPHSLTTRQDGGPFRPADSPDPEVEREFTRELQRLEREIDLERKRQELEEAKAATRRAQSQKALQFNLGAWLAGAGAGELRGCSDSEQRKVSAIGYTVLVPTIFALLSASYAASTLTPNPYVIWGVAFAWSVIILLVDRAIIATYSPDLHFFSKAGVITLRVCVAMLMGATVSHPLTLLLFKDTINAEIEAKRDLELAQARDAFAGRKKELEGNIERQQAEVDRQRQRYEDSYQPKVLEGPGAAATPLPGGLTPQEQAQLQQRTEEAAKPFRAELADVEARLQAEEARSAKLQTEIDEWQRQYEAEIGGQRSGMSGIGPRARSIQADQLDWRRAEMVRTTEELRTLTERRRQIQAAITASGDALRQEMERVAAERTAQAQKDQERLAGLQRELKEKQLAALVSDGDATRQQAQAGIDAALGELTRLRKELDDLSDQERSRVEDLRSNPRRDMLTQTLALHHLFEDPTKGGHFALIAYLVLAGLFLAIDTMPILVKFTCKPGEYDALRKQSIEATKNRPSVRRLDERELSQFDDLMVSHHRQQLERDLAVRRQEDRRKAIEEERRTVDEERKKIEDQIALVKAAEKLAEAKKKAEARDAQRLS